MRLTRLLSIVLLACCLNACSDEGTSPVETKGRGFSISFAHTDSVYLGDTVIVTVRNAPNNDLTVFLHSLKLPVDQSRIGNPGEQLISFIIPPFASTGLLRVYAGDSLAAGSHTLVVLPLDSRKLKPTITSLKPDQAYSGDLLLLSGRNMPMRWKDYSIYINDVAVPVVLWDSDQVVARITDNVISGPITLYMLGKEYKPGFFRKLLHTGTFLHENTLAGISIQGSGITGSVLDEEIVDGDSIRFFEPYDDQMRAGEAIEPIAGIRSNDSISFSTEQIVGQDTVAIEVRLEAMANSRVSGTIRMWTRDHLHKRSDRYELEIRNMRWSYGSERYTIYSYSSDIPNELVYFFSDIRFGKKREELIEYTGANDHAAFTIELFPSL